MALAAMAENMEGKHGETLFRVMTKPNQMRSAQTGVTAESLQQTAIQLLATKELPALRTKLAQQLGAVAANFRKPLVAMLLQQRADNLRAQIELYARTDLDEASRRSLQGGFALYGREALNQLMSVSELTGTNGNAYGTQTGAGVAVPMPMPMPMPTAVPGTTAAGGYPGTEAGGASPLTSLTPELASELVTGLWSKQFAGEVAKTVAGAKATDAALIQLAATMPLSPVRGSFQQLVDKHAKSGPGGLIESQTLADVVRDPGLLLVLKSVQWKNRPKTALPAASGSGDNTSGPPRSKTGTSRKDGPDQWLDAYEEILKAMAGRFSAANRKGNAAAPPIKLPRGDITTEYYLKWPDDLSGGAKQLGVAPMTVHYLRLETSDPRARDTVSGQVRNKRTHAIHGGFWYENRLSQKGMLSSLDVVVGQAGAADGATGGPNNVAGTGSGRPKNQAQVIQLLYVEIEDYSK
jgi:hypothetical protein